MSTHAPLHVWVPGLSETGGIQHYSRCLVRALGELFPDNALKVFSKNDKPGENEVSSSAQLRCFGQWQGTARTAAFASSALLAAWRDRPTACISTHPHFAKALRYSRSPYLVVEHGIETWGHLHGSMKTSLQAANGHLPVSNFTRDVLIREGGIEPSRIVTVPDTFREDAFAPGPKPGYLLQRHGLKADQPVLLTVGRLNPDEAYKGHDQVIAALPILRSSHPETRYVIVGTGADEARLRQCAADHGQSDAVIFAGFIAEQELADYYRLCDLFVMPSTGEGFGIVYLEALASGRPCIVGNLDASPEAIGNGRLGFVVNPRSPQEIADTAIQWLARQDAKPWLHEPETLRREVVALFGFQAFKQSLRQALHLLLPALQPASR